jgi:hypothetical protein
MPKPGKRLANIARLENTGCLRHASRFDHGSNNDGYFDMGNLKVGQGHDEMEMGWLTFCCCRRWGQTRAGETGTGIAEEGECRAGAKSP